MQNNIYIYIYKSRKQGGGKTEMECAEIETYDFEGKKKSGAITDQR